MENNKIIVNYKYPLIKDEYLQKKIALKKEYQYKYDDKVIDITTEDLCEKNNFILSSHQEFVKTFINYNTPYNGLLLFHGMGSGKTCSAIGITEEFRKNNKYNSNFKKINIIASPNVQKNFKLQLFDKDKLVKKNNMWNLGGCVGSSLLYELKDYNIENMEKDKIVSKINKIINKNYSFNGYEQFSKRIKKLIDMVPVGKGKDKKIKKLLNYKYEYAMIVIDEVHNIRRIGEDPKKKISKSFELLLHYVSNMKLLFLSGTPMYNDPKEIIYLSNLLNKNDGQKPINVQDVFDKNGDIKKSGEKVLIKNLNGYVSYIRGENPYYFPLKIFPNDYNSEYSIKKKDYPKIQFNKKKIDMPLQYLDIHLNTLSEFQKEAYYYFIEQEKQKIITKDFENMDSFGYNTLQNLIYALNICYYDKDNEQFVTGKNGLETIVDCTREKKNYNYINNDDERIFDYENIGKYSCKIKSIIDCILNSDGPILIYSQVLDGGLIPIALALESIGFKRCGQTNLWDKSIEKDFTPLNVKTMKNNTKTNIKEQAKYMMITGDKDHTEKENIELKIMNQPENKNGHLCKVVLVSQAGAEGIDFKNLRQVHILDPWYNLNRLEQIQGRAIRYCSHKLLPLQQRNCNIYLHGSYINDIEECIDLLVYRYAERKGKRIGKVQNLLKSISVDCLLNEGQQKFANLDQNINIKLSNKINIDYNIKDKPYTNICDFLEDCNYKCINKIDSLSNVEDITSYKFNHLIRETIIDEIKKLFLKNHVYKRNDIFRLIKLKKNNIQNEHINYALTYLLDNKHDFITDKYLRKGRLINIKDLYIFLPIELDKASLYEIKKPLLQNVKKLKIENLKEVKKNNIELENNDKLKELLDNIKDNYEQSKILVESVNENNTFYEYYLNTINYINKNITKINDNNKDKIIIQHIIQELSIEEDVLLLEYLFKNKQLTEFENKLKDYYNDYIHTFEIIEDNTNITIFLGIPSKKNKEFFSAYIKNDITNKNQTIWTKASLNEIVSYGLSSPIKQKLHKQEKFNKYYGFIEYVEKEKVYKLKIKYTGNTRKNTGHFFSQKNPVDKKKFINEITGKSIFNTAPRARSNISGTQIEIIAEILLRLYDIINKDKRFFLNKLEKIIKT